ncbi:RNA-directed DNA polymerase [Mesorhizobium sp. B292B1B]|uniref:RNA-directed DNA polymerase n=1 Tax=unclassified Mesorhizobium TaxID=325217 RepID=UPI00112CAF00|nr:MULTISPECIES: RNA-directed DNA polymerase [unclassified Mesorhizobium]MCA0010494.1 RNA-directed DNA polymerase [Mesorhizobium sp. B294B1A1]MCA0036312.1 RNA-directed DNA polymerase [Mesorhizobium sp. B292B1B]TPM49386.1 RNA-directed DNA polymerase [Mesorhizobium sp. B2-3-2]
MSAFDAIITAKNARPIWKKLSESIVPIIGAKELKEIVASVDQLKADIKQNKYIPSIGHGYLGYLKSAGCTRFVPILTADDMTVYYLIVLALQEYLIEDFEGVYGAYRSVPKSAKKVKDPEKEDDIIDPYFRDTFSRRAWFKDWSQFTDLLIETCNDSTVGNYVLVSDVANFYDTIDIGGLINNIRSKVPGNDEIVSLLGYFLNYWDRRIKGYSPSSKGIPQEIISDASRIVSNFYLNEFDRKFIEHCKTEKILYLRWADDIVLFGKSRIQLENTMHQASRLLLNLGLNFNASKTRHFSRREFREYRALSLLSSVSKKNIGAFDRELRRFSARYPSKGGRIDTVVKASLNFLSAEPKARTLFAMSYLREKLHEYEFLSGLNESQLLKKYLLYGNIGLELRKDIEIVLRHPYAAPRATFLSLIRKYKIRLLKEGVSASTLKSLVDRIEMESQDSEINLSICVPAARAAI